jgi:hypothetical protein
LITTRGQKRTSPRIVAQPIPLRRFLMGTLERFNMRSFVQSLPGTIAAASPFDVAHGERK